MKQRKNKRICIRLKASATIEAAVIVPITLVIIAAVLVLVFILHDWVILSTASLYEIMEEAGDGEDSGEIQESVSAMLGKRLITADVAGVSADASEDRISVDAEGSVQIPMQLLRTLLGEGFSRIGGEVRVSNLNGRKLLVRYKTICDGVSAFTEE